MRPRALRSNKSKQQIDRLSSDSGRPPNAAATPFGRVICAGTDANAEQVRRGMAWVFDRYSRRGSPLHELQRQAQATRRGLWASVDPVPPWEWRRLRHRD